MDNIITKNRRHNRANPSRYQFEDGVLTKRRCGKCKEMKPVSDFGKHTRAKFGLGCWCKNCRPIDTRVGGGKHRTSRTQSFVYALGSYEEMYKRQNGKCAICGRDNNGKRFAVDHNHENGVVRGLLCVGCNLGIGNLQDNVSNLINAAKYLIRSRLLKTE
jgi:hypothetical protein